MFEQLSDRCNVIEEFYEFMLAFAGQGLPGEPGTGKGALVRDFLSRAAKALTGLADVFGAAIEEEGVEQPELYRAFLPVLQRDAEASLAAIELVRAQPSISSQLIDNLNASIHLRALLTDLFLIDEVVKAQQTSRQPAETA